MSGWLKAIAVSVSVILTVVANRHLSPMRNGAERAARAAGEQNEATQRLATIEQERQRQERAGRDAAAQARRSARFPFATEIDPVYAFAEAAEY